jgi:4-aminobutyrate aminotransferase-like enzyme/Ser/Thr protein kinase RdoA (MazF antagonist)
VSSDAGTTYDRIAGRPEPVPADDARAALLAFGITPATLAALPGEVDRNVLVEDTSGQRFVLKLGGGDVAAADFQRHVLERLATIPDLTVPQVFATTDGTPHTWTEVAGSRTFARLLTWVPGRMLHDLPHRTPLLLEELGELAGRCCVALADLEPPASIGSHHWDMAAAGAGIRQCLEHLAPDERRAVDRVLQWLDDLVAPHLADLPRGVVHQDLNDHNVLATQDADGTHHVSGVIDVGDALRTIRVAELAVAAAYVMRGTDDPLAALRSACRGFGRVVSLTDAEAAVVFPLAVARLCLNAVTWRQRDVTEGGNSYARDRMRGSWPAVLALSELSPVRAEGHVRAALGREPHPDVVRIGRWLSEAADPGPLLAGSAQPAWLDLTPGSDLFDDPRTTPRDATAAEVARQRAAARLPLGSFGEVRLERAGRRRTGAAEPASLSLALDVFAATGTEVLAPLTGIVRVADDGCVALLHTPVDGPPAVSTFRGITSALSPGDEVARGDVLGRVTGDDGVQVQLTSAALAGTGTARWCRVSERDVVLREYADPTPLLGGPSAPQPRPSLDDVLRQRETRFARSQRAYYARPMSLVRSSGAWLTDEDGYHYLDAVNNVSHVGHAHPAVVEAAARQMRKLNTNSRFVYRVLGEYTERLAATLPRGLDVVFLVCTGSEANDLALRMARVATGREDVLVIDGAYHGNTTAVTGISPNRYRQTGGAGKPPTTHEVAQPNGYRGFFSYDDADAGSKYAGLVGAEAGRLVSEGRAPAAFIAESLMGTAGQIVHPDGYLPAAFAAARAAGALCISDEVQVGFGRLGDDAFWGFEVNGAQPDIVTMGKPIGNGHPLAAVVTSAEIAEAFDNGMRYFNTFGGNPVSCAVGLAVLDVMEREGLQRRGDEVGRRLLAGLQGLMSRHPLIGDVRGQGLYIGVELVRDRETLEPAAAEARIVAERMKEEGVVLIPNGEFDNVLKLKPPMVFSHDDADLLLDRLDAVLTQGW